ncbi:MAG: S41 family peptidase [Gemmatimonadales bacterium]
MTRAGRPVVGLLLVAAPLAAQARQATRAPTLYEDLQMFSQVLNQIRVNHLDSVDTHALILAAVEGMIQAADPHSYLLPVARLSPEKAQALEDGKLWPVPVAFGFFGGSPVVASVAPLSKAAQADILQGDELIAVDGQPVTAGSAEELSIVLAGEKGSSVTLRLSRRRADGSNFEIDRVVKREAPGADATAVPVSQMLDATTGYLRITTFANPKVADDLHDAIGTLKARGMKRLVLDLRDNGGGLVDEAARVAGEFLPSGTLVYVTEQRKDAKPDSVRVKRSFWKKEDRYPLVLLVNEGTASASELVAGALQDHDRALLVGRTTFGKSLLMRGFPLLDGSVIMMAFGRVKTPCGRAVQRDYHGVTRRDYYRLAGAVRDTAGRPNCRTDGGRTVYGGGGVRPDIELAEPAAPPLWLARIGEEGLVLKWAGGYLTNHPLPPLDSLAAAPKLPAGALADFETFATSQGLPVPAEAAGRDRLERALLRQLALVRYGDSGYHRVAGALDPVIAGALAYFEQADAIMPKP